MSLRPLVLLVLGALLGCVRTVDPPPPKPPSAPAQPVDACAATRVVDADATVVERCARIQLADPRHFADWARAALDQRKPPPVPLLRGLSEALRTSPVKAEEFGVRVALIDHLVRAGEPEAALAQRRALADASGLPPFDRATRTAVAANHLALAADAASRSDLPSRCEHLKEAIRADISLRAPIHEIDAIRCPQSYVGAFCSELAGVGHFEQARVCLLQAIADPAIAQLSTVDPDHADEFQRGLDDLFLTVHAQLGPPALPKLRTLAQSRPSLRKRLSHLKKCKSPRMDSNDLTELSSVGVYLALSHDDTLAPLARHCYARVAASLCLAAYREGWDCPTPEALVAYTRVASGNELDLLLWSIRPIKKAGYDTLAAQGCSAISETLFYLHFAIAEILLRRPSFVNTREVITDPQQQVCRMRSFYRSTFNQDMPAEDEPVGAEQYSCVGIELCGPAPSR